MIIDIVGMQWEVTLAEAHSPNLMVANEPCGGTTWYGHQKIYISDELSPACALRVIRHEVTHAYMWSTQISLPETFDEEYICDFVAIYGPQILKASEEIFQKMWQGRALENEIDSGV